MDFAFVANRSRPFLRLLFAMVFIGVPAAAPFGGQAATAQAAAPLRAAPESVQPRPLLAATPSVSLGGLGSVMIAEDFTFTVSFSNTGADVGYGPFIDLIFPVNGADGANNTNPPLDGVDFVSASAVGYTFNAGDDTLSILTFPDDVSGTGCGSHPWAKDSSGASLTVCGPSGDKLVSLRLPFGSFVPGQPAVEVSVQAKLSEFADLNTPLTIRARGGFIYGLTPLDDWCCGDLPILNPTTNDGAGWPSGDVIPQVFTFSKSYIGPGNTQDETATGPNFPRQYVLTVDIADGQAVTDLDVSDLLPDNAQFISLDAANTTAGYSITSTPGALAPGGVLTLRYAAVTGASSTEDVKVTFNFYVPLLDASSGDVIDPASGDDAASGNIAWAGGDWTPLDTRDAPRTVTSDATCPTCPPLHTLQDKSIAIQKSVSNATDSDYSPGDVLEYTLVFQVSDFFAFGDIVVTDVISDGQHLLPATSFVPTLQVNGNSYTLGSADFNSANYDVDCNYSGGFGAECTINTDPTVDGTTLLTFRVSDEINGRQPSSSGRMVGGCIDPTTGSTPPNCSTYDDGPTTATIVFRTIIQENFTDTYPSGDPSVDQGDTLDDTAVVLGSVLDVTTFAVGQPEEDDAAASLSIGRENLSKAIYAVNGDTNSSNWDKDANGKVEVKPNDTITYRLTYTLKTSDVEDLYLEDYLPLPVFYVADPDADDYSAPNHSDGPAWIFDDVQDAAVPAAGHAKFGPGDTFRAYSGIVPTLTSAASQNKLTFTYGDYDDTRDQSTTVDLLFTVTAAQDPFADRLFITNEAHVYEGSTNAGTSSADALLGIVLTQPVLSTTKSVIWSDSPSAVYNPTSTGPVTFLAPGNNPRWTGTINSTNLASSPIDSDVSGIDAGDTVSFAIVIENTGSSLKGAFDLVIRDTIPSVFDIPTTPTGLNLQIYYGDGSGPITYNGLGGGPDGTNGTADDIFGSGIELDDPTADQGVCQAHNPNLGNNIILITYDLHVKTSVTPGTFTNTGGLTNYAGYEGGPSHIPSTGSVFPDDYPTEVWDVSVQDTADVTVNAVPDKYLAATSEAHTSDPDVTIGEIVRYRLAVRIPEGTSPNFQVRDRLPGGLVFMNDGTATMVFVSSTDNSITSSAVDAVPAIPNTCDLIGSTADAMTPPAPLPCTLADENIANTSDTTSNTDAYTSGTDVYFRLGDLGNTDNDYDEEYVVIEFNALVHNQSLNQNDDGDTRTNRARAYINGVQSGDDSSGVNVNIVEPLLTLDKTNSTLSTTPAQTLDAGDTVTYTVTLDNLGASGSSADAFDIHFEDTLPVSDLDLDVASVSVTGGVGVTNNSSDVNNKVDIVIDEIALGDTVTITYDAVVKTTVTPSQAVDNTGDVTWTSLPGPAGTTGNSTGSDTPGGSGSDNGERDSSDGVGGATDDYAATDSSSFNVHDPLFSKSLEATSATHTADPSVAIGEVATFGLYVTLSEGTTPSLQVVDDLPVGFDYIPGSTQVITQTSPPASCGSLAADFNGTLPAPTITAPGGSGADVTFDFGQITVVDDNDTTNNRFLICFDAVVLNEAGNQDGDTLTNSSTVQVGTNAPVSSNDVDANVVEPVLAIVKSVNDDQPASGQDIDFTLTVSHDGASTAAAFDVNITDNLPAGLDLDLASVNVTLAGGASGVTDNSSGSNVDIVIGEIPLGGSVTIEFTANVSAAFASNMTNQADMTWTSISGADANERTGSGSGPNDYTASSTVDIGVYKRVLKSLIASNHAATVSPDVTIGEILTYEVRLTIPPNDSDTYIVVDTLDSGLAFVDCSQITAAASVTSTTVDFTDVNNCNHGAVAGTNNPLIENSGGRVAFDLGTVTNTAGSFEDVVITYRVVVLDVIANLDGVALSNNVEAAWPSASQTRRATPDLAIIESDLLLEKTVDRTVVAPGSSVTYSLHVVHTADSHTSAYDLLITDVISDRLIIPPGGIVVVNESGQPFDRYNYDAATRTLTIEWDDFPTGNESVVSFTVQVGTLKPGASVINTANLAWTSLPGTPTAAAGQPPGVQSAYNSASTERRYDPTNQADFYGVQSSVVFSLPETGFAPGRATIIPQQPRAKAYQDLGALWLEIPRLGVQLPIIGVPLGSDGWDLTWLWDQAGYLEGTAYPTWAGNTAITAHVYLPDGEPGPFVDLHTLQWGDQIILHANGRVYTYEVRETRRVRPNDISVLKHESYDWVTLITCQDYNEAQDTYAYRVVVRAVLLRVEAEFTPPLVGGR